MSEPHKSHSFTLPNGHTVHFEPRPEVSHDAYVLRLVGNGGENLSVTCTCNGATATCKTGKSLTCDCTKSPPKLTCT
jgi:hypothetical protein